MYYIHFMGPLFIAKYYALVLIFAIQLSLTIDDSIEFNREYYMRKNKHT